MSIDWGFPTESFKLRMTAYSFNEKAREKNVSLHLVKDVWEKHEYETARDAFDLMDSLYLYGPDGFKKAVAMVLGKRQQTTAGGKRRWWRRIRGMV